MWQALKQIEFITSLKFYLRLVVFRGIINFNVNLFQGKHLCVKQVQ